MGTQIPRPLPEDLPEFLVIEVERLGPDKWVASFPSLPGVELHGASRSEAVSHAVSFATSLGAGSSDDEHDGDEGDTPSPPTRVGS